MKRIAVIPNNSKDIGLVNTKRLVEFLNGKAEIYIDEAYSVLGLNVNYVAESEILDNAEYLIVLGGDGTILQRAAECAKRKIPVLGINLGKIGFMTEIEIDDMEDAISKFLQDDFTVEKRMMMKAKIRKENKAIIFISHKLEEIFQLADVITVFRNGKKVAYSEIKDVDTGWVIKQMTGRELDQNERFYSTKVSDEVLLEVDGLTGEKFTNVSFKLKKGEILGFSGLVGAGRSEVMQAIFGYLPVYKGSVKLDGEDWKLGDTNYSVKHGFIYLPEERKKQGILPVLSIRDNISVSVLDELKSGISISRKKENELAKNVIETYDVKTPGADKEIQFLSGGNQQKVIIGRAMACKPKLLVFDEPTKGIDVGTKTEIYRLMKKLAEEEGIGIIMISSEMEEIKKCSNRVIAMYEGRIAGEFDEYTEQQAILGAIIGVDS